MWEQFGTISILIRWWWIAAWLNKCPGLGLGSVFTRAPESTPLDKYTPPSVSGVYRNVQEQHSHTDPQSQKAQLFVLQAVFMDFPKEETRILEFWKEIDAFRTSVKLSEGRKPYTFYDGPPFCTG